jgi:hypothetical protein
MRRSRSRIGSRHSGRSDVELRTQPESGPCTRQKNASGASDCLQCIKERFRASRRRDTVSRQAARSSPNSCAPARRRAQRASGRDSAPRRSARAASLSDRIVRDVVRLSSRRARESRGRDTISRDAARHERFCLREPRCTTGSFSIQFDFSAVVHGIPETVRGIPEVVHGISEPCIAIGESCTRSAALASGIPGSNLYISQIFMHPGTHYGNLGRRSRNLVVCSGNPATALSNPGASLANVGASLPPPANRARGVSITSGKN